MSPSDSAPQLEQLLRRGQRRQMLRRTVVGFRWGLLLAAAVALGFVVYDRLMAPGWFEYRWIPWGLGVTPVVAALLTLLLALRSQGSVGAALEIESRYPLRERFSTLLLTPQEQMSAEARAALVVDGEAHVSAVQLQRAIPIHWRRGWGPTLSVLLVLGAVHLWLPAFDLMGVEEERRVEEARSDQVKERKRELKKRLDKIREGVREKKMSEGTRKLLDRLAKQDEERRNQPKTGDADRDRKKALAEMSQAKSAVEARKQQIEAKMQRIEKVTGQIRRANNQPKTEIGKKLQSALAKGDLDAAAKAMQKLAQEMQKTGLSEGQKKALKKDLKSLAEQMKEMPPSVSKKMEAMAKALEKMPTTELDKLAGQMESAADQMSQLQRLMRERDMLDQMSDEIQMTEDELASLPREWPEEQEDCPG